MGVERLFRNAEAKRNVIPMPWIRIPRDPIELVQIVEVIDMIPDSEVESVRTFWNSLRAHAAYLVNKQWNA